MSSSEKETEKTEKSFLDSDLYAANPGLMPYAHSVGAPAFRPINIDKTKHYALSAMEEQTNAQLSQLYEQAELLAKQAQAIKTRAEISLKIYASKMSFKPVIGKTYYLYQRKNEEFVLSMVAPEEWGSKIPFARYVSACKLLSDHTWDINNLDNFEQVQNPND
ncbi:MAG: DUF2452 domain-containing protein [Luteibaculaceae bacterium]